MFWQTHQFQLLHFPYVNSEHDECMCRLLWRIHWCAYIAIKISFRRLPSFPRRSILYRVLQCQFTKSDGGPSSGWLRAVSGGGCGWNKWYLSMRMMWAKKYGNKQTQHTDNDNNKIKDSKMSNAARFDSSRQQCVAQRQINILRSAFFSHPISTFARRTRRRMKKSKRFSISRHKSPMGLALAATRVGKRPKNSKQFKYWSECLGICWSLIDCRHFPFSVFSCRGPIRGTRNSKTKIGCVETVCSVISAPDSMRTFNNSLFPLFYEQKDEKNETKSFGYTTVKIEFISSMWHIAGVNA